MFKGAMMEPSFPQVTLDERSFGRQGDGRASPDGDLLKLAIRTKPNPLTIRREKWMRGTLRSRKDGRVGIRQQPSGEQGCASAGSRLQVNDPRPIGRERKNRARQIQVQAHQRLQFGGARRAIGDPGNAGKREGQYRCRNPTCYTEPRP
jgi:hypothetical protein